MSGDPESRSVGFVAKGRPNPGGGGFGQLTKQKAAAAGARGASLHRRLASPPRLVAPTDVACFHTWKPSPSPGEKVTTCFAEVVWT